MSAHFTIHSLDILVYVNSSTWSLVTCQTSNDDGKKMKMRNCIVIEILRRGGLWKGLKIF